MQKIKEFFVLRHLQIHNPADPIPTNPIPTNPNQPTPTEQP